MAVARVLLAMGRAFNAMAGWLEDQRVGLEEETPRIDRYSAFGRRIAGQSDAEELGATILGELAALTGAERAVLFAFDPDDDARAGRRSPLAGSPPPRPSFPRKGRTRERSPSARSFASPPAPPSASSTAARSSASRSRSCSIPTRRAAWSSPSACAPATPRFRSSRARSTRATSGPRRSGRSAFLLKPFTRAELERAIVEALEGTLAVWPTTPTA